MRDGPGGAQQRTAGAGPEGSDGPEGAVVAELRRLGWTLGLAESMTAGGVAARLARVDGVSDVLRGGLVVYATDTKAVLAGVDEDVLRREGPVSAVVAGQLAAGARTRLRADVGLSLVGVAGPTMQGGQPVGTVHVGVALPDGAEVHEHLTLEPSGRVELQRRAVVAALEVLWRTLVATGPDPHRGAEPVEGA